MKLKLAMVCLALGGSVVFANPPGDDGSLEAKALISVTSKVFKRDFYEDKDYPVSLARDIVFLKHLDSNPDLLNYLPPYSYWFDAIEELQRLRGES